MFFGWSGRWIEALSEWSATTEPEQPPLSHVPGVKLSAVRTFAETFPVVGIPSAAFIDAGNVLIEFSNLQANLDGFSEHLTTHRVAPELRRSFVSQLRTLLVSVRRMWLLFMDDVCTALEYLIRERRCYDIPWAESVDRMEEEATLDEMVKQVERVGARVGILYDEHTRFEREFSGAPPV